MNHLLILESNPNAQVGKGRNNLLIKTSGRFYTPKFIGERLVDSVLTVVSRIKKQGEFSVIDPFCGDGRLIVWLITHAEIFPELTDRNWYIELWDCDANAIELARQNIQKTAERLGLNFTLKAFVRDSFTYFSSKFKNNQLSDEQAFDVVITNSPWEIVKPDRRDIKVLDKTAEAFYLNSLREFSKQLEINFPLSKPLRMFSGWGMNLARVGTEIAVRLAGKKGVTGVVSPVSIFSDQNSEKLRKWLLTEHAIQYIDYFPAETRLFDGVDQDCVNITIEANKSSQKIHLYKFDASLNLQESHQSLDISNNFLKSNGYVLPISLDNNQLNELLRLSNLPKLGDWQGNNEGELWIGRELDETGHTKFITSKGIHPFLKGKMIQRLDKIKQPTTFINQDQNITIPSSVNYPRIVWRDVSRQTQKRRVQGTIIPAGWVTGNSLGVAHFRTEDISKLYTLLGIMSSLVFEFQVRAMLSTAHVSVGVLRKTHVPIITSQLTATLSELVSRRLTGELDAEVEMEVYVAKAYGLNQKSLFEIMKSFPKLSEKEQSKILNHPLWEKQ